MDEVRLSEWAGLGSKVYGVGGDCTSEPGPVCVGFRPPPPGSYVGPVVPRRVRLPEGFSVLPSGRDPGRMLLVGPQNRPSPIRAADLLALARQGEYGITLVN